MLKKLRETLKRLREAMERDARLIRKAKRRIAANRRRKEEAERAEAVAEGRIRFWVAKVKKIHERRHRTAQNIRKVRERIKELEAQGVRFYTDGNGDHLEGGTPGQRYEFGLLKAAELDYTKGHRFYSQAGAWSTNRVITGENPGYRSDCSQFLLGMMKLAGLPDPGNYDFTAGYTGTMLLARNGWRECSVAELKEKGWGYVVYGDGVGFHTEGFVGPDDRTVGHGDARVNYGVVYLFGGSTTTRCFIYDPS